MSIFKGPLRTGGILNKVAHDHHIHGPIQTINSVLVCRKHNVKTEEEMVQTLKQHADEVCSLCGEYAVGGGMENWTQNLWLAVKEEEAKSFVGNAYSLITRADCANFIYDLFVRSPIRGVYMEDKALSDLSKDTRYLCEGRHATAKEDVGFAIDLVFGECVGIQVKPESFLQQSHRDPKHMEACLKRQRKWGREVFWLYYDNRTLEWVNYNDVSNKLVGELESISDPS
jgi:hypothetical protein